MPRTPEELDATRREDLRSIVEAEAALLLLMNRSTKTTPKRQTASQRSKDVMDRAEQVGKIGWGMAVAASFETTSQQAFAAVGAEPEFGVDDVAGDLDDIASATIAQGAHAIAAAELAGEIDGQSDNTAAKAATVASVLAVTAFTRTRDAFVARLPKGKREELWVRRDTAGDRRVCPACDRMDGDTAPASVGLSPKAPLHPNCRCTDTLISREEAEIAPPQQARTEAVAEPPRAKSLTDGGRSVARPTGRRAKPLRPGDTRRLVSMAEKILKQRRQATPAKAAQVTLRLKKKLKAKSAQQQLEEFRRRKERLRKSTASKRGISGRTRAEAKRELRRTEFTQ